ncbi:MAG: glycosyltransferase family 2 protein [bacterium]
MKKNKSNLSEYPLVSVIIPLYNQKQFVGEAIESILEQSYPNIEIIVVNDGSTDDPGKILEQFCGKITLINQENRGLAGARNTGINNAHGEYFQFLDADDFLHRDKIKLQLEYSEIEEDSISYCEISRYYGDKNAIFSRNVGKIEDIFSRYYNLWDYYPTPIHSLLFKKETIQKFGLFPEDLKANEDRYYLAKMAAAGVKFHYFPFIGGYYRIHQKSMNAQKIHIINNFIIFYKKINSELGNDIIKERYSYSGQQMMSANLTYIYLCEVKNGTRIRELRQIKKIIKNDIPKFEVKPIPSRIKNFKRIKLFLISHIKRWMRKIKFLMSSN